MSYADPSLAAELNPRARRRRLLRKRFLRRPFAVIGLMVAVGFIVSGIFAPVIAPYHPDTSDFNATCLRARRGSTSSARTSSAATSFSRLLWGSRASIQAGVFATLLATLIAVPIGLVAGYYRGWIDPVIARVTDVLLAFPFLIVAVGLAAILGASLRNATIALCLGAIPGLIRVVARRGARVARGGLRPRRDRERRERRHASSASTSSRTCCSTIIVQMTVTIPAADHRRGRAVVPRPRRPVAADVVGRDALRREGLPRRPRRGSSSTPASRSSSARCRSTCSATACATSSIRGRPGSPCRCSKSTGSASGSKPTTASSRPSTSLSFVARRARGARHRRRVRLREERQPDEPHASAPADREGRRDGALRRHRAAHARRRSRSAGSAGARSRSSSRSR